MQISVLVAVVHQAAVLVQVVALVVQVVVPVQAHQVVLPVQAHQVVPPVQAHQVVLQVQAHQAVLPVQALPHQAALLVLVVAQVLLAVAVVQVQVVVHPQAHPVVLVLSLSVDSKKFVMKKLWKAAAAVKEKVKTLHLALIHPHPLLGVPTGSTLEPILAPLQLQIITIKL